MEVVILDDLVEYVKQEVKNKQKKERKKKERRVKTIKTKYNIHPFLSLDEWMIQKFCMTGVSEYYKLKMNEVVEIQ